MEKIKWCISVRNGIELVESNENLSKIYFLKAENALRASASLKDNKEWEIPSSYYAMYFALYAIMMKIGIKCENHACSIEFMKHFLSKKFDITDILFIENAMSARIDIQYYTDRAITNELYLRILKNAPLFVVKCKEVLRQLKDKEIEEIRMLIMQLQRHK